VGDAKAQKRFSRWLIHVSVLHLHIFIIFLFVTNIGRLAAGDDAPPISPEKELLPILKECNVVIPDLQQRVKESGHRITNVTQQEISPNLDVPVQVAEIERQPLASETEPKDESRQLSDPDQFEVNEQVVERALERTLVQTGVLLLPFGQVEIESGFEFTRAERDVPVLVTAEDTTFLTTEDVRRNMFDIDLQFRFGLPFDSQFELSIPYRYVGESRITGNIAGTETNDHGKGFDDLRFGLAKTLFREERWSPDLAARVVWDSDFGETRDNDIVLGGGFHELSGVLNAVKRQDPLVFIGALSYQETIKKNGVKPGSELSFTIGAALAASPESVLRFVLTQTFVSDLKLDNKTVNESDQLISSLGLGVSSIVGLGKLLSVSVNIGLTDDAPDYSARVSLSKRFGIIPRR